MNIFQIFFFSLFFEIFLRFFLAALLNVTFQSVNKVFFKGILINIVKQTRRTTTISGLFQFPEKPSCAVK